MVRPVALFFYKCLKSGSLGYFYPKNKWSFGVTFSPVGGNVARKYSVG